jgi:hypothetical protein
MAYPANMAPAGFLPVNLIGGRVFNQAIRQIPIASGYAQNIGYGDLVTYTTDGTIVRVDTSAGAKAAFASAPVGIFLGCQYNQTTGLKYTLDSQYWPTGTVASDAKAFVCEDPDAIFLVTLTNASGVAYTSGGATQANVGENIGYYEPSTFVNTVTGNSNVSANLASSATTSTLPFRIVDVVRDTALSDGSFQQVLVTYNFGLHFYRQATGI